MKMKVSAVLLVAVLVAGCAAFADSNYMPSEGQLKSRNPYLLNCPGGSVPRCEVYGGGRVGARYKNCHCAAKPF